MKTHIKSGDIAIENVAPGVRRQIMGYDTDLMLVRVYFDKGGVGELHAHVHQQVSFVEKGKFEVEIYGKKEILQAGDCYIVPSNAWHGAICLEEGILIDTFSPARQDFLEKK